MEEKVREPNSTQETIKTYLFDQLVVPSVVKIVARVGWPCQYSDLGVALREIEESTWEALTACRDDCIDCPQES